MQGTALYLSAENADRTAGLQQNTANFYQINPQPPVTRYRDTFFFLAIRGNLGYRGVNLKHSDLGKPKFADRIAPCPKTTRKSRWNPFYRAF